MKHGAVLRISVGLPRMSDTSPPIRPICSSLLHIPGLAHNHFSNHGISLARSSHPYVHRSFSHNIILTTSRKPHLIVRSTTTPIRNSQPAIQNLTESQSSICDIQDKFRNGIYEFPKLYTPNPNPNPTYLITNKPQRLNNRKNAPRSNNPPTPSLHNNPKPRKTRPHGPRTAKTHPRPQRPRRRRQDTVLNGNARSPRPAPDAEPTECRGDAGCDYLRH